MAAKAEALAKQFETKVQEATAVLERLSDADWKKTTSSEKWTVAWSRTTWRGRTKAIAGIIKAVASGQSMGNFTMEMLHDMNAKHAQEHANATRADTVALHKKSARRPPRSSCAGSATRISARAGPSSPGCRPMSVEQIVSGILLNHIDEHLKSIKATVGA